MSVKVIKNNTGSAVLVSDVGITVPASGQYTIPPQEYLVWAASDDVFTLINASTLTVNDGAADLPTFLGTAFLKDNVAKSLGFDNTINGFPAGATDVQKAIESILAFDPQTTTAAQFDDFNNMITWSPSTAGLGASASVSAANTTFASGKHLGVAQILYGTVGGHASLVQSATLSVSTVFGNGKGEYRTLIRIPTLATAIDDYTLRLGYGTSVNADHANGVYFEYNRSLSTNWRLKTANQSIRTSVNSSIPVVNNAWIQLSWIVNAAGTQVDFYVDGVLAGSITTNIPIVTGQGCGPNYQIVSTVLLAGQRSCLIDYFYFIKYFTARD
jgi:hypothetical protein